MSAANLWFVLWHKNEYDARKKLKTEIARSEVKIEILDAKNFPLSMLKSEITFDPMDG